MDVLESNAEIVDLVIDYLNRKTSRSGHAIATAITEKFGTTNKIQAILTALETFEFIKSSKDAGRSLIFELDKKGFDVIKSGDYKSYVEYQKLLEHKQQIQFEANLFNAVWKRRLFFITNGMGIIGFILSITLALKEFGSEDTSLDKPINNDNQIAELLVSNFYNWYVNNGYFEMKPNFTELENGMTDMDFDRYDKAHYRFHFTEQLINKSKNLYKDCRTNLSKIPYTEFSSYEDLDQFEAIGCNFQFWQWFGTSMDPYKYFELTKTEKLNDNKFEITVGFSWQEGEQLSNFVPVTIERVNNEWKIADIGVDWN